MELNIALLPGDGIGPEVIDQAVKVSNAIAKKFNHKINWTPALTGADAIDKVGDPYPEETHEICMKSDAILFGAIGHPKYDNDPNAKVRPEQGLLKMRKKLGLFANIRPTFTFPSLINKSPLKKERIEGTDLIFVRELTSGIYFGKSGRKNKGNIAFDTCTYSRKEIIRLAKKGFELAMRRSKNLCCVDKANVLESSRLWRETVQLMEKDYPEVNVSYEFVDAVAMRLIQWPNSYDVLITIPCLFFIIKNLDFKISKFINSSSALVIISVGKKFSIIECGKGLFSTIIFFSSSDMFLLSNIYNIW